MIQEEYMGQTARRIDDREARAVERSIFGSQSGRRSKTASLERKPVLDTPLDLSVIDAYFASLEGKPAVGATALKTPAVAPAPASAPTLAPTPASAPTPVSAPAPAAAPASALTPAAPNVPPEVQAAAELDGSGVPEADRLFAPPTADEAAYALRDLPWGEHIVATRMASSRGNTSTYLFSLEQAVTFFLEDSAGGASLSLSGSFAWIDFDKFSDWMRTVVGDTRFADALEDQLAERDAYNDRIEVLRRLLALRWAQYEPFAHPQEQESLTHEGEENAGASGELSETPLANV